jgi:hypothetical protein
MVLDLEIHERTADSRRGRIAEPRRRRRGRPSLGRPRSSPTSLRPTPPPAHRPLVLSDAERSRRLAVAARALVRTIRGCPAPGVPPLRARDWLAIGAVLLGPYLIVLAVLAVAGR